MAIKYKDWIISLLFAIGLGFLTWILLQITILGPFHLEEVSDLYELKRTLLGNIIFLPLLILVSAFRDNRSLPKDEVKDAGLYNKYLEITTISLRLLFSAYLFAFWYIFLPYSWFSRISLSFAFTFPPYYYWILDSGILLMSFCGTFWVVVEPWHKLVTRNRQKLSTLQLSLIRIFVYFLINLLFLSCKFLEPLYDMEYIAGISLLFLISSLVMLFFLRRASFEYL